MRKFPGLLHHSFPELETKTVILTATVIETYQDYKIKIEWVVIVTTIMLTQSILAIICIIVKIVNVQQLSLYDYDEEKLKRRTML